MIIQLLFLLFIQIQISNGYTCKELNAMGGDLITVTIKEGMGCINMYEISLEDQKKVGTYTNQLLQSYAFLDILKDPPQPEGYPYYYSSVDMEQEITKICKKINFDLFSYFYRDMKNLIIKTKDLHLKFDLGWVDGIERSEMMNFYYYLPFDIKMKNKRMYFVTELDYIQVIQLKVSMEKIQLNL